MRTVLAVAWLLLLPALTLAKPTKSTAPPPDEHRDAAKRFAESGTLLFNRGDFLDSARQFELAYAELAEPALLYNIANAYDKGGDRKKAIEAYRKYAKAMPDAESAGALARAQVIENEWKELEAARRPVAPAPLPPPLPFNEPITKHTFQTWLTVDGKPYTLIGVGARKVYGFKVYAMGLYVDDEGARRAFPRLAGSAGGSDHDSLMRGDQAAQFVVLGEFGKSALLHFVRKVSGKEIRDNYREALGDTASTKAPLALKRDADAFLALFEDMKDGDECVIRTTADGRVFVSQHGVERAGPVNLGLTHDIWDIWLGRTPISSDLKRGLVDRIDTLGR